MSVVQANPLPSSKAPKFMKYWLKLDPDARNNQILKEFLKIGKENII